MAELISRSMSVTNDVDKHQKQLGQGQGQGQGQGHPTLTHTNSWPSVSPELLKTGDQPLTPEGEQDPSLPAAGDAERRAMAPEPAKQREIILALNTDSTYSYAVGRNWLRRWEHYVGVPRGSLPGSTRYPGPIDMDNRTPANNDYISEDKWKHLLQWYGLAENHQLDRRHNFFRDERPFDLCVLSPFSGIIEHSVKEFSRFEQVGYIECQLRRMFKVPQRPSRLWISEKAMVPHFQMLLNRPQMLNESINRSKQYILAVEVADTYGRWPTGEPGEPIGELTVYRSVTEGSVFPSAARQQFNDCLSGLIRSISQDIGERLEQFFREAEQLQERKAAALDTLRTAVEDKMQETTERRERLQTQAQSLADLEDKLKDEVTRVEAERQEFISRRERLDVEMQQMRYLYQIQESRVTLNVGGQMFSTSLQTLQRYERSLFASMFSGQYEMKRDSDGSYFLDRDGTHFRHILNYLRDDALDYSTLPTEPKALRELLREAKYYQLGDMAAELETVLREQQP